MWKRVALLDIVEEQGKSDDHSSYDLFNEMRQ